MQAQVYLSLEIQTQRIHNAYLGDAAAGFPGEAMIIYRTHLHVVDIREVTYGTDKHTLENGRPRA